MGTKLSCYVSYIITYNEKKYLIEHCLDTAGRQHVLHREISPGHDSTTPPPLSPYHTCVSLVDMNTKINIAADARHV